jgi:uncharacterized membrane protein
MESRDLSWGGIIARLVAALVLVYATFNPSGHSWYHWALEPLFATPSAALATITPLKALAGIALLACWWFFLHASQRSLGVAGAGFIFLFLAALFWGLSRWHIFTPSSAGAVAHLVLITVAIVLGVGLSWSSIKRRVTGQQDTDEI